LCFDQEAGIKTSGNTVGNFVRAGRFAFGLISLIALAPWVSAQQEPVHGCGAAVSCRPLGFSTLTGNSNSVVFGGFSFCPGFSFHIVTPRPSAPSSEETSQVGVRVIRLRNVSLLPSPTPTPAPAPAPTAATPPDPRP
jgi:hypothetical protein